MKGATEHVQPQQRRVAENKESYTKEEFEGHYGAEQYHYYWDKAPWSCDETVDPQTPPTAPLAQPMLVVSSDATEHALDGDTVVETHDKIKHSISDTDKIPSTETPRPKPAPPLPPITQQLASSSSSGITQQQAAEPLPNVPSVFAEHTQAPIIWSIEDALAFRANFHGQQAARHNEAREALNNLTQSAELGAAEHSLDSYFRWKEYVALHKDYENIISTGIIAARAERVQDTSDSNRSGQNRTDFVFYRTDNTWCRVHPGTKTKNDAQIRVGTSTTEDGRISNMYQVIPTMPFTMETAALIPQTDVFGKKDALAKLQTVQLGVLGVTEHDAFKWWLFFPTLDKKHKADMFGPGISEVELCHQTATGAVLRIGRSDLSVKYLVLKKLSRKIKTELCNDAAEAAEAM